MVCRPCAGGDPSLDVTLGKWIPACAGTTRSKWSCAKEKCLESQDEILSKLGGEMSACEN